MAHWEVLTRSGSVQVEGGNWLMALGVALPVLGLEPDILARLVCDVQPDGVVRIVDPISRTPFLVRRLREDQVPPGVRSVVPVGVVAAGGPAAPVEEEVADSVELDPDDDADDEIDVRAPAPVLDMPAPSAASFTEQPEEDASVLDPAVLDAPEPGLVPPSSIPAVHHRFAPKVPAPRPSEFTEAQIQTLDDIEPLISGEFQNPLSQPPDDLEETLFIRGMDVADAGSISAAAEATLALLEELIPAESSSVLYAGINDTALRFIAAHGPTADKLDDIAVPLGSGIAGFCFDNGSALIVRNAEADPRHLHEVDQATGYHTRDMLSVALRDSSGGIHGCIQLLNPRTGRFLPWHLEAASTVGATLADYLLSQRA